MEHTALALAEATHSDERRSVWNSGDADDWVALGVYSLCCEVHHLLSRICGWVPAPKLHTSNGVLRVRKV